MSQKPKKPNNRKGMPDDLRKLESSQGRCPGGHLLPHRTNKARCTPVYCAGSTSGKDTNGVSTSPGEAIANTDIGNAIKGHKSRALAEISRQADTIIDAMIPGDTAAGQAARLAAKAQKAEHLVKIGHDIGRFAAVRAYFKVPEGLEGAKAEEFVKNKAEALSVDAIVDLERDMKLGDDTQRREARRDLFDMLGIRKRENAPQARSVIVLVGQPGVPNSRPVAPWEEAKRKQIQASNQTVDVQVVEQLPVGPQGPKGGQS
jgi:hypothetical protein